LAYTSPNSEGAARSLGTSAAIEFIAVLPPGPPPYISPPMSVSFAPSVSEGSPSSRAASCGATGKHAYKSVKASCCGRTSAIRSAASPASRAPSHRCSSGR